MTAPAEDPRGGEVCDCRACSYGHPMECEYEAERSVQAALRAAGRGDTDSGGEHGPGKCVSVEDANRVLAEARAGAEYFAARPAGERAQPTQELREAIAQQRAEQFGTLWNDLTERIGTKDVFRAEADQILALPAVAALLDAQAAVNRVEALADEFDANINWREWGIGNRIRHALRGP